MRRRKENSSARRGRLEYAAAQRGEIVKKKRDDGSVMNVNRNIKSRQMEILIFYERIGSISLVVPQTINFFVVKEN